jgi:hypothetical protein
VPLHTPHFGPYAGVLCRDGIPVTLDPNHTAGPVVALPDCVPSTAAEKHARGVDGAALALYKESKKYGAEMPYEQCRSRVATARTTAARKKE